MENADALLLVFYHALMEDSLNVGESLLERRIQKAEIKDLPLIDLAQLADSHFDRSKCVNDIIRAATEWGFFQVVNHGVPEEVLKAMKHEQKKAFHEPDYSKNESGFYNLRESYRLGNPVATSPTQISWSEAFHIAVNEVSRLDQNRNLRIVELNDLVSFLLSTVEWRRRMSKSGPRDVPPASLKMKNDYRAIADVLCLRWTVLDRDETEALSSKVLDWKRDNEVTSRLPSLHQNF